MELKRSFRSGIVLLELLASILIFALAGAVCIRVLIKADETSARSRALSEGVSCASSAAELIRAADSEAQVLENLTAAWPQTQAGEEILVPFENGKLTVSATREGALHRYVITWRPPDEDSYRLEIIRFFPEVTYE